MKMTINGLMQEKGLSRYRLSKISRNLKIYLTE